MTVVPQTKLIYWWWIFPLVAIVYTHKHYLLLLLLFSFKMIAYLAVLRMSQPLDNYVTLWPKALETLSARVICRFWATNAYADFPWSCHTRLLSLKLWCWVTQLIVFWNTHIAVKCNSVWLVYSWSISPRSYIVLGGALNSTHSLTSVMCIQNCRCLLWV